MLCSLRKNLPGCPCKDGTAALMIILSMIAVLATFDLTHFLSNTACYFTFESKLTTKYDIEIIDHTCRVVFMIRLAVFSCILSVIGISSQLDYANDNCSILRVLSRLTATHKHGFVYNILSSSKSDSPAYKTSEQVVNLSLLLSGDVELNPGPGNEAAPSKFADSPRREPIKGRPASIQNIESMEDIHLAISQFTDSSRREPIKGRPVSVQIIERVEDIHRGDHIIYYLVDSNKYRTTYCSALVVNIGKHNEGCCFVHVITNCREGVVEKKIAYDEFLNLHKVLYSSGHYHDEDACVERAKSRMDEDHHSCLKNNSHHFVTWCKTGQEHSLTVIIQRLEEKRCPKRDKLGNVTFKYCVKSIDEMSPGNHVILDNIHYLVESVDHQATTFSAYSLCKNKRVELFENIALIEDADLDLHVDILDCIHHRNRVSCDEARQRAKEEMEKVAKRKWVSSDTFVTAMLCGIEHSMPKKYILNHNVAPKGCTLITPKTTIAKGDHLAVKDFSNKFASVIVLEKCSDTRVVVKPPLHEGDIINITTYPEVYRVEYDECLPESETLKRANSQLGEQCLQKNSSDHSRYVAWAKTGREISTPISDFLHDMHTTEKRSISYEKITSLNLKAGDHVLEYCPIKRRRRHMLVTNSEGHVNEMKVICCRHTSVHEESKVFNLSGERELYKIKYEVEEVVFTNDMCIKKARSYLGKQLHNPWAPMLLITWSKTGEMQNFNYKPSCDPISRSEIRSFKQLVPGDYLIVKPQSKIRGKCKHYLIVSVDSREQCSVVEYSHWQVSKKELTFYKLDQYKYYRINYIPGTCLPNEDSVTKALSLVGNRPGIKGINCQNFIHMLKTEHMLEQNVDVLKIPLEHHPETRVVNRYLGTPSFTRQVDSLDELSAGNHIIFRGNEPPYPPVYVSAIVCKVERQQVEIATLTIDGIVKRNHELSALPNLHQVVYHFTRYSKSQVLQRIDTLLENSGNYYFDESCNNSHHFVTRCKTDQEYSLTEFLNEISQKEQCFSQLKPVLTKVTVKSIEDLKRGDHIVIKSQHYLVDSVDHEQDTLSAYTTNKEQIVSNTQVKNIQDHITEKVIFLIEYDCHCSLSNVTNSFERVRMEIHKKSKWQHSHQFVTMIKCGIDYVIDDRCYIDHDADISSTRVTQFTSVDVGDHLIIRDEDYPERYFSTLVCSHVDQTTFCVVPPISSLSSKRSQIIELTAFSEVYRVNYKQSLPSAEATERALSNVGKSVLQKPENSSDENYHGPFVTWTKTGREMQVPIKTIIENQQIELAHPVEYRKVLSPDELEVGQHIFVKYRTYKHHYLITECNVDPSCPAMFKLIYCTFTKIKEKNIPLNFDSVGEDIYQVIYQDELPTELTLERARSRIGETNLSPTARMWFVPWAKTGSDDGIEVDFLRNLTSPVSKSRITCFTQLNEGDYLVEDPGCSSAYHHYLVASIESPEKCTVFESWYGKVINKEQNLHLNSLFYRINYESGVCVSVKESLHKAEDVQRNQGFLRYFPTSEHSRRSFVHYLKTRESADINISKLLDDRTLLRREIINSAMELKPGDHIERPLSLAPSFAQHHMLVVEPIDDKHCKVIHYKVHPTPNQLAKKGEVVMETVNIFEQNECNRVCYSERLDPEEGIANLSQLCGKEGKTILKEFTGNEEYSIIGSNCEHLVTIATLGVPLSIQVDKFFYQALQTGKSLARSFRLSCLHHGVHLTPDCTMHGACHASAGGGKAGLKIGIKAAASGSVLGTVAGIAFAVNLLIEGPLCVRSIYKLKRQYKFKRISLEEYKRGRDTLLITTANTIIGGTAGAVVGQLAIFPVPILGAAVGGVVGNLAGQFCGKLEAKLYCHFKHPHPIEITLPEIVLKEFKMHNELLVTQKMSKL